VLPERSTQNESVTLELAGARISVTSGFDRALLREVVSALREVRS
jgi:hypothetical protein